jgi:hypothetical protein
MSSRTSKATRKIRGAQKWILQELRAIGPSVRLSTSQIAKRISKARGKSFHKNSIYNALRILVQRGHVTVVRDGHEKLYQATGASSAGTGTGTVSSSRQPVASAPVKMGAEGSAGMLPHKLGLGEILVLGIERGEVLTATNQHGRLVLERHPVPD